MQPNRQILERQASASGVSLCTGHCRAPSYNRGHRGRSIARRRSGIGGPRSLTFPTCGTLRNRHHHQGNQPIVPPPREMKPAADVADIEGKDNASAAADAAATFLRRIRKVDAELVSPICDEESDAAANAAAALLRRIAKLDQKVPFTEGASSLCGTHLQPLEGLLEDRLEERLSEYSGDAASRRKVRFQLCANTLHEVPAYSEIYGLHPREFVFGRNYCILPSGGDHGFLDLSAFLRRSKNACEEDEDCEDCEATSSTENLSDAESDEEADDSD